MKNNRFVFLWVFIFVAVFLFQSNNVFGVTSDYFSKFFQRKSDNSREIIKPPVESQPPIKIYPISDRNNDDLQKDSQNYSGSIRKKLKGIPSQSDFIFYSDAQFLSICPILGQLHVVDVLENKNTSFIINGGDTTENLPPNVSVCSSITTSWTWPADWQIFSSSTNPVINKVGSSNYFIARGNHDKMNPNISSSPQSFTKNGIHISIIDVSADTASAYSTSSAAWRSTLSWLDQDLQTASTQSDFLVVAFHEPPFSSHSYGSGDIAKALRATLVPLFKKHGVDLVLNGHIHNFEKYVDDNGTTYIISGGGGGARQSGNLLDKKHRHIVEVTKKNNPTSLFIKVTGIDETGSVPQEYEINSFTISPILPVQPPILPGVASFSEQSTIRGSSYSFSVVEAQADTYGDLYKSESGGSYVKTKNWIKTNSNGKAYKGPWVCANPKADKIYIQWPDGSKTNIADHNCIESNQSGNASFNGEKTPHGGTYSFSIAGGPVNTYGDLYKSEFGGPYIKTTNWLKTNSNGNVQKGPWTCTAQKADRMYIQWPNGTKTNSSIHYCSNQEGIYPTINYQESSLGLAMMEEIVHWSTNWPERMCFLMNFCF
ncbi:MAG TPA: metallophosphoesterase [Candidatus Paceibacterota bacterium]|nr:metallophosphoesterase [Candidatus Paceibacterota bacterium]